MKNANVAMLLCCYVAFIPQ